VQPVVDQLLVGIVADISPVGIENLARRAGAQILAHVVVGRRDSQLVRLVEHHLLLHQLLAHLLLKHLHDHWVAGVLRIALPQLVLGDLLHVCLADGVARRQDAAIPVRIDNGVRVGRRGPHSAQAGNQVQDHGDRSRADDDHDQRLDHAIICLQETNHGWTSTFNSLSAGRPNGRASAQNLLCARRACGCAIFARYDSAIIVDRPPRTDRRTILAQKTALRTTGIPPKPDARFFLVPLVPCSLGPCF